MEGAELKEITIIVKWCGKEYPVSELTAEDTVAMLRHEICKRTQVRPDRQKLLNLKYKGANAGDEVKLGVLEMKPNYKLMMVGSLEEDIKNVCNKPFDTNDVLDDFEDVDHDTNIPVQKLQIYLAKINKRVREYTIKELNPPRENKRLLVLDIDYTLFDHRSSAEMGHELMRPFLHDFLESAYADYDIVIWSATGMRWIEEKMRLLKVNTNPNYKIMFYMDWGAMISVYTSDRGVTDVKPLGVIWGKYKQYSARNTIMFDDVKRNFLMNPQSGLRIRPFRRAHISRSTDRELFKLKKYLKDLADHCPDFTKVNHSKWESYDPEPASEPELDLEHRPA